MKNEKYLISIILPTYNGAKYIKKSILSCLDQTYKNLELIIVNDGSDDKTEDIINSIEDKRIKVYRHKNNRGIPESLNTGFKYSSGNFLTWTSDDNYYKKEALEEMIDFLVRKSADFIFTDFYKIQDNNKKLIKLSQNIRLDSFNNIGPCFLYTRKLMKTIGKYNLDAILVEDYDYWIRISKVFKMYHLNIPLYFYNIRKSSISSLQEHTILTKSVFLRYKYNLIQKRGVLKQLLNLSGNIFTKSKDSLPRRINYFLNVNKILNNLRNKDNLTETTNDYLAFLNNFK